MCIDMGDYIDLDNELTSTADLETNQIDTDIILKRNGETKRDAIKNSLLYL